MHRHGTSNYSRGDTAPKTAQAAAWMVAACVLFAGMGACVKAASVRFAPNELVFWRGAIAFVLIATWAAATGRPLATAYGRWHLLRGVAGVAALFCYFHALAMIPLATAITLNYTSPLFLALIVAFGFSRPLAPGTWLALAGGFVGVVLIARPAVAVDQWAGVVMALGAGATASVAYLGVRRLGQRGEPEWRIVFYFSLLATLAGLPGVDWGAVGAIDLHASLLLAGIGLLGLAAQLCMTAAYKRGRAVNTAALSNLTIVFGSALGMIVWNEMLPLSAWLGAGLIVWACVKATAAVRTASLPTAATEAAR